MSLIPRAHYLTEPLRVSERSPAQFGTDLLAHLPAAVTALTGAVRSARLPEQGACNLVLLLETDGGRFLLKVAQGCYRSQELLAEHLTMQSLQESPIPVPRSLAFAEHGGLSFQLREYIPGQPLNEVLAADEAIRPHAIRQMGETLAAIHRIRPEGTWTWDQWLDASLERAALNMETEVYDPEDFYPDDPPRAVLHWLRTNRPAAGDLCLLHGDYRPKNLLWQENRVASVIDWAFVDIGDPYYDLSIFHWYMRDEAEWEQFLGAYGLTAFDQERFRYCMALHKFLNV